MRRKRCLSSPKHQSARGEEVDGAGLEGVRWGNEPAVPCRTSSERQRAGSRVHVVTKEVEG